MDFWNDLGLFKIFFDSGYSHSVHSLIQAPIFEFSHRQANTKIKMCCLPLPPPATAWTPRLNCRNRDSVHPFYLVVISLLAREKQLI